jgi:hypothetical protein
VTTKRAHLAHDLDCSDYSFGPAIVAIRPATIDLRGFTIAAGTIPTSVITTQHGRLTVLGGGTITGGRWGITGRNVKVQETTIMGPSNTGVDGRRRVDLDGVTISQTGIEAVTSPRRVRIRNSTITDCGGYPQPDDGEISLSSATVWAKTIKVESSVIANNYSGGLESLDGRVIVRDSIVAGNGTNPDCGVTLACNYDIGSQRRPRLRNVTCDRSFDFSQSASDCDGGDAISPGCDPRIHHWGACDDDASP